MFSFSKLRHDVLRKRRVPLISVEFVGVLCVFGLNSRSERDADNARHLFAVTGGQNS